MKKPAPWRLGYTEQAYEHFKAIEAKHHSAIRDAIELQLSRAPEAETRNKKRLKVPALLAATWELRCGQGNRFRVFYVVESMDHAVVIVALGVKDRKRLMVGGEEIAT